MLKLRKSPQAATRIFIARHGQTVSNREGRFCGHSETDLTDLGRKQAEALGRRLEGIDLHAVYTSDFSRAIQTAAAAIAGRKLRPRTDPDLRELHYGEWEMEREAYVRQVWPEQHALMRAEDPAWHPPGGENVAGVRKRTYGALERIIAAHRGEHVLVVTHGTAINCLVSEMLGVPVENTFRFSVANCGLTEVLVVHGRPTLILLNDTSHLAGIASPHE